MAILGFSVSPCGMRGDLDRTTNLLVGGRTALPPSHSHLSNHASCIQTISHSVTHMQRFESRQCNCCSSHYVFLSLFKSITWSTGATSQFKSLTFPESSCLRWIDKRQHIFIQFCILDILLAGNDYSQPHSLPSNSWCTCAGIHAPHRCC